ncbi:MAG: hypothetical protein KGM47_00495, partial [Acidobacteriota bacterium]|nr:hypothetical protein [Acidobacteriota bacterium]
MRSHQMALRSCLAILSGSLIFPLAVLAQSSPAAAGGRRKEDVLLLLKRQLQAQRRQIESLTRELAAQQQLLNRLTMDEGKVPDHGRADTSVAQKSLGRLNRPTASSPVPDRASQAAQSAAAEASRANGGLNGEMVIPQAEESKGSPAARKIGSATLTPFGFVDATAFFRTRNLGSGIGSSFGSLPFSNTVQGHM